MSLFKHKSPLAFVAQQTKVSKSQESAKKLALEFGRKSTIHAMNRIFQENSHLYERLFWLTTLVMAFLGSIYVSLIISRRFNAGSLQTVVDSTNKPVFEIPFPEVSICNKNRLNWQRLEEAKKQFLPHENNTKKLQLFELVMGLYDNLEYGAFHVFNALKEQPMGLVNSINFSLVYNFMSWRCEELLSDCVWHYAKVNCCEVFLKSKGLSGLCWHFNTLSIEEGRQKVLEDKKYPWRIGSEGPGSGLNLRVQINPEKHYGKSNKKGVLISISEPKVYYKEPYFLPANTEAAIELEPIIYFYDNGTKSLSSARRRCLFNGETINEGYKYLVDFPYMFENCETQCRQEYLLKYCNCTLDLFFPYDGYRACTAEDLLCLAKNNNYFRSTHQFGEEKYVRSKIKGMVCECFRNCYSLNYIGNVRSSFLPQYLRGNQTYVDLDVYYIFAKMIVYRTSLVFNWVDLMVAFGGIAGLFLGCSLISGIELLYFAFVEVPMLMLNKFKSQAKIQSLNEQPYKKFDMQYISNKRLKNHKIFGQNMQQDDEDIHENNMNANILHYKAFIQ